MAQNSPHSLVTDFKDVIKQITIEVSKQSVLQELKRSEETMKQSVSQLPVITKSLGDSAHLLEVLLQKNAAEIISINQKISKIESMIDEATLIIEGKQEEANKQITNLLNESVSSLRTQFQNSADTTKKLVLEAISGINHKMEKMDEKHTKFRTSLYWFLRIQILLSVAIPTGLYFLLK